jgi:hypothetical protein
LVQVDLADGLPIDASSQKVSFHLPQIHRVSGNDDLLAAVIDTYRSIPTQILRGTNVQQAASNFWR